MIQDESKNETEVRRFLLGEMSEEERSAFEEQFVSDETVFEQTRLIEDELIESYLRRNLPSAEIIKFERSFLTTEPRRQRVAFMRAMIDTLTQQNVTAAAKTTGAVSEDPSVWTSVASFFKTQRFAFGAALVIVIAAFGGWFFLRNSRNPEVARQSRAAPRTETVQSDQNNTSNANLKPLGEVEPNKNNSGQTNEASDGNSNTLDKETAASPILALFAGTIRAEGKTKVLNLPKDAKNVLLQLNLDRQDYKIYRAEIITVNGESVLKNKHLQAKNSKISLYVPARKLSRGDYIVKLSALNPQYKDESVADYTFRVNRK